MGEIIQVLGLNNTIIAQIFNFLILLFLLVIPLVIIIKIFRSYRTLESRVRKLEEILIEKGGAQQRKHTN